MLRRHSGSTDEDDELEDKTDTKTQTESTSSPALDKSDSSDKTKPSRSTKKVQWHQDLISEATNESKEDKKDRKSTMEQPEWKRPRLRGPWRASLLVLSTTALSIFILFSVVSSFMSRHRDPVGCAQVWMAPIYAKYEGFDTEHTRFASKYGLYLYREGGKNEDFTVKGVPVLFITGNAGSHKQVRSIAAEAAAYWSNHLSRDPNTKAKGLRDFDFFTADFNEDITAFHGQTMLDQAEYLNDAVAYILSLYHDSQNPRRDPDEPDPTSVIIIGHSMGGIVARTMLTLPNYQANSVNTIITLSSPHARAPVSFDEDIVATYKKINGYWRDSYSQQWATDNPLSHVTLVSLAGGGLDTVVPSDYASLSSLVPPSHGFTVFTSTSPNVWTGCDHLAILWCDQLRKAVVKSLFDIVDVRRHGQTKPRAERMRIFRKRFLTGLEGDDSNISHDEDPTAYITLEDDSNKILTSSERLTIRGLGRSGSKRYLLPIPAVPDLPSEKRFTLLTNQPADDAGNIRDLEVLLCSVYPLHLSGNGALSARDSDEKGSSGSTRLACRAAGPDLVQLPASTPSSTYPFRTTDPFSYFQYSMDEISDYQFVAIIDKSKTSSNGWVIAEFSDNSRSEIHSNTGLGQLLRSGLHLSLPADRPMMTTIKIPAIYSSLLVYKLRIGAQSCADGSLFTPLVRQYMQDPYESKYFVNVKEADINFHGVSPFMPPPLRSAPAQEGLSLQMWTDPTCGTSIDVSLIPDLKGSLGKFVMRYRTVYPAIPLVVIALVLRKQFVVHDRTGVFITFFDSLALCMKSSLPALIISMTIFSFTLTGTSSSNPLPSWGGNATESVIDYTKNDLLLGSPDPIFWFLIPIAGILGVGACVLVNYVALSLVHILRSIAALTTSLSQKFRKNHHRRLTGQVFSSTPPRRRLLITLLLFFLISTVIPYQFAYLVACVVQLITCTRALRAAQEVRSSVTNNFYNYAHSILVLMLWVLPINIPVLVVWIHNLAVHWLTPFSSHHNILSIMPFVLLVESLTGGTMIPRISTSFRHVTNILFFILAVYAALYGVTYAYQLHDIANVIAAWLVILQFSSSEISMARISRIIEGREDLQTGQHIKKRP